MRVADKPHKKSGGLGETISVIIQALILALVIRTFLFQPFSIPSGSMRPTLLEGDYLFVTKWAYGYSRYSLPFSLPLFSGRIWGGEPERGDVVVFKFPPDPSLDYIKRVIGLPGDKVQCCDSEGRLLVNGEPIDEEAYIKPGSKPSEQEFNITVPEGHLWVMGDNRGESSDSRFHDPDGTGKQGSVSTDLVVGKAFIKVWPLDRMGTLDSHEEVFSDVPAAGGQALVGAGSP